MAGSIGNNFHLPSSIGSLGGAGGVQQNRQIIAKPALEANENQSIGLQKESFQSSALLGQLPTVELEEQTATKTAEPLASPGAKAPSKPAFDPNAPLLMDDSSFSSLGATLPNSEEGKASISVNTSSVNAPLFDSGFGNFGFNIPNDALGLDSNLTTKAPINNGTITPENFNFDKGLDTVSSAQKFVIPIPDFSKGGGEDLVYPAGAKDKEGKDIGGQPITDWKGNPIAGPGEKGVVFFNHKDQSWQAAKGDGQGVIILNQVTEEQAKKLQDKLGKNPESFTLESLKGALEFAHSDLDVGDAYNSNRTFIKDKMNPMESSDTGVPQYGLFRRDDRDVCKAVYVAGSGEFQGPAATPQKFEDGAVLIRQPNGDGFSYRLCQPGIFKETYKRKDGAEVTDKDYAKYAQAPEASNSEASAPTDTSTAQ